MLVGRATRLAQFLDKDRKEYAATIRFGFATDTGDRTGKEIPDSGFRTPNSEFEISGEELEAVLKDFRGEIWQTPPMYSAKKRDGVKLYELARQGIEIEREPIKISIHELEIITPPKLNDFSPTETPVDEKTDDPPSAIRVLESEIKVLCSAGTYIRTLAEDIGEKLQVGAHLAELRRTRAGKFDLQKALTLEDLETMAAENRLDDFLISMNEAVSHLPEIVLDAQAVADTKNGKRQTVENTTLTDNQTVRMTDAAQNLIAVGNYLAAEKSIQPKIVLV